MLGGAFSQNQSKTNSLINEYASLLGDAVLRHRTKVAERTARIEAELASKVKSEFIANMSHELRTPLNTVMGFSKLLGEHDKRALQPGEIVEYANMIHDAAGHLLSVINSVLDMSKIQSGKYVIDSRDTDIDEILTASLASMKLAAQDAGVTLQTQIADDLPAVRGDSVKLRQVFTNILSNAIKFTPKDGSIAIEARKSAVGGAIIIFRDTGVGMSDEEVLVALTPFGQVDASRARWREGTGLGLPIAKALVQLHGGKLQIRSAPGAGTEVAVMLPASG